MEKIKNLLNPGKKHDDEVLYGSGDSSDPHHSGTAGQSSSTTGTTGLGSSTTGTHGHDTSNPTSGLGSGTTQTHDPLTSNTSAALGDTSSRTAGAYDDDTSSTTAIRGGVPGTNTQSGLGLTDTNKPSSNEPGRLGTLGHLEGEGRQNEPFSSSTDPSQTTGTTGTGLTGSHHTGSDTTGGHHTGSGLTGSHNASATAPTTGTTGTSAGVAGTDHSSRTLPDRSVGGSTTGTGSKTDEILAVAANRGERGAEEIEDPKNRRFPQSTSDNTATSSGIGSSTHHPSTTSSGLGSTTDPTNTGSHLGRDVGLGGAALGGAGLSEHEHNRGLGHTTGTTNETRGIVGGPENWEHAHTGRGHEFVGDPCGPGVPPAGPHFVEGPHTTDTANRLDPHASTRGPHTHGSSTAGQGLESSDRHHTEREAALAGGAGIAGVGAHEESRHHHQHDPASAGTTSTGTDPSLTGPVHNSSLLNKLDPRVKSADATGTTGTTGTSSEHHGRDAAGGAALGTTGHEAEKHHHHKDHIDPTSTTGPTSSTGLTGPTGTAGTVGTSDRRLGRDAAGGAAIGAAGYEAEKHHNHKDHTDPMSATGTTGTSPQYGTSEPVAGTGTSDKHHNSHHDKETHHEKKHEKEHEQEHEKKHGGLLGFLHRDKTHKAEEPKHHDKHQDATHHHGHDAATTGAVGAGAAGVTEHEHEKHERNRLHKDPPASMRAGETEAGYGEKPTSGYASQVTGGTGTTALAQGDNFQRGSHFSGMGNRLDPAVDDPVNAPGASVAGDRATDPDTGLPVDTSKKFEGFGTDDVPHHGTTGTGTNTAPGGPLTSRREDATGEQLTAGDKYHDPANMGYGEGLTSSQGASGTHHGLSSGAPHTGPSGSTGI